MNAITHQPFSRKLIALASACLCLALTGCGGSYEPEVDLDRVLEIFELTLQEPIRASENAKSTPRDATPATGKATKVVVVEITPEKQDAAKNETFLKLFTAKLNEAKLHKSNLGTRQDTAGRIVGFTDENADMSLDADEHDVFSLELDPNGGRVVATDQQDKSIHRDRTYNSYYRPYSGFWTGYMLGSMSGSHNSYYRSNPTARTNFSKMSMAPKGYAKPGSSFRASRSSARSMGGSRSFSGGK